jgi:hypothetical protein
LLLGPDAPADGRPVRIDRRDPDEVTGLPPETCRLGIVHQQDPTIEVRDPDGVGHAVEQSTNERQAVVRGPPRGGDLRIPSRHDVRRRDDGDAEHEHRQRGDEGDLEVGVEQPFGPTTDGDEADGQRDRDRSAEQQPPEVGGAVGAGDRAKGASPAPQQVRADHQREEGHGRVNRHGHGTERRQQRSHAVRIGHERDDRRDAGAGQQHVSEPRRSGSGPDAEHDRERDEVRGTGRCHPARQRDARLVLAGEWQQSVDPEVDPEGVLREREQSDETGRHREGRARPPCVGRCPAAQRSRDSGRAGGSRGPCSASSARGPGRCW